MPENTSNISIPVHPDASLITALDCGLIVLNKPKRVLSHPNHFQDEKDSIVQAPYNAEKQCFTWTDSNMNQSVELYLLHRLDVSTSGLILLAYGEGLAAHIKSLFKDRLVKKTYLAVVKGEMHFRGGEWKDYLIKDEKRSRTRASTSGRGDLAVTHVRPLQTRYRGQVVSLVEMSPLTGRTHQLRVQSSTRHHPILGDPKYGDFSLNRWAQSQYQTKRMFLHAFKIECRFSFLGKKYHLEAESPMPAEFSAVMGMEGTKPKPKPRAPRPKGRSF